MSTLGVSHPSPTTVEDFRRVLDERAIQPLAEPVTLDVACPEDLRPTIELGEERLRVVVE